MSTPKSRHPRATPEQQARLLSGLIERIREAEKRFTPLVVLDLDGTLVDNRPRTCAILHELAEHWADTHPHHSERLKQARYEALEYLLADNLRLLGIEEDETIALALDFWKQRFFYDERLRHDIALDGSVEFARACYDAGATLVYFTGRDLPNMALGTLASLRDLGFPIGIPGTELVLKPSAELSDEIFKREVTPLMRRSGVVTAAFDNEPGNCNIFKELFPETDVFMLDTQHFPGAPPLDPRVHVIGDFSLGP
jgi:hypothetical protein